MNMFFKFPLCMTVVTIMATSMISCSDNNNGSNTSNGLSDEELKALGEKTVASGKNLLLGGKSEPKQEPQEMWDGDFDFLMDFWF